MSLIKPKKLKSGSKIAVVSPSWGGPATHPHRYLAGKNQLEKAFNVTVTEMPHTLKDAAWIHNNPKARAEDLMMAFEDSSIDGIIASIGGDDSIRLLPFLDLDIIKNNPKVFMGYSDTTILHFACFKAGLSSFYGPSIMAGFAENSGIFDYMHNAVRKTIFSNEPVGDIPAAEMWTVEHLDWADPKNQLQKRHLQKSSGRRLLQGEGQVSGHLIGGCVDVFPMILGTSLWPDLSAFDKAIFFVETSEEAPNVDDIKRIFRNLGVQGILERLSGILIGRPGGQVTDLFRYDGAILDVVANEFGLKNLPILAQMDFGHTDPMFVIPYGAACTIACEEKTMFLKHPACI